MQVYSKETRARFLGGKRARFVVVDMSELPINHLQHGCW
jgi:hypothetical protein